MNWLSSIGYGLYSIGEGLASIFGLTQRPKFRRIKRHRTVAAALQADRDAVAKDWEKVARDLGGKR